jgi:hypothetical protein
MKLRGNLAQRNLILFVIGLNLVKESNPGKKFMVVCGGNWKKYIFTKIGKRFQFWMYNGKYDMDHTSDMVPYRLCIWV